MEVLTQRRRGADRLQSARRARLPHSLRFLCAFAPLREIICISFFLSLFPFLGCSIFHRGSPFASPAPIQNPMFIPPIDREFLWNQTVDAIDDYFRIEREDRVRLIAGVLTEGRIDTFPTIGSTVFEPWRTDSTPGYE